MFSVATFGEDEAGELYFSHLATSTAGAVYKLVWKDSDGDGMPDDLENLAGTNPTNVNSYLHITATGSSNADWTVVFPSVSNKLYRLERNGDVMNTNWVTVTNNIAGTGNSLQILDPGGASTSQRFYRVRLLP